VKIVARLEHDQLTPYGLVVHHHHPPTRIGKTTVAASVGSIFAQLRQDGRVVAIDADTAFGKLTARVDLHATGSYWDLAGPPTSTSTPSPTCAKGSDALPQSWHRLGHRHVPLEAKLCGYGAVAVPIVAATSLTMCPRNQRAAGAARTSRSRITRPSSVGSRWTRRQRDRHTATSCRR
jgi:hypothetical protein